MSLQKAVNQARYKVYSFVNFVQREFAYSTQIDHHGKYLPFGANDAFPVKLTKLIQGSPTATSCLSTWADFIAGEGFNEGEDLENLKVNRSGLTFFQYHSIQSASMAKNWGIATLVKYNRVGQITEFEPLPFGSCRLGVPDDNGIISKIHYNPYFGTALQRDFDTVIYDAYNPEAATMQASRHMKWKGQIYWFGIRDDKDPFYPIPDHYSAEHWMNVEKNAAIYFDDQLENGFLQDTIMKMIGDPNDPSGQKTPEGDEIPKGELFDTEMTNNFAGAKKRHRILAVWGNNKEEWPELQAFPSSGNPDLFRVQDEHAIRKITIATKVPGVLANIQDSNNFSGEQIRPAVKLMQQRASRPQSLLISIYQDLLRHMVNPITEPVGIVDYNPYPETNAVDPQTWAEMSKPERRKWIRDNTEVDLDETDVAETVTQSQQPLLPAENKILNLHFDSYPEKAKANVKRALEWQQKMGTRCVGKAGELISNSILDGKPLGPKDIRRLSRFLSKNAIHSSKPWGESCEAVAYYAWGGSDMMAWANEKVKELHG
jgi:hypothetical protein